MDFANHRDGRENDTHLPYYLLTVINKAIRRLPEELLEEAKDIGGYVFKYDNGDRRYHFSHFVMLRWEVKLKWEVKSKVTKVILNMCK